MSTLGRGMALGLVLGLAGSLSGGVAVGANQITTYKWVDEQGVVHYGDSIPPQYAEKGHKLLNGQGVEIGHTEAQKTPEQLAAEAQEHDAVVKQQQHDNFLLTTYTSVQDIESLRDV